MKLITTAEAAAILGVGARTVRYHFDRGRIAGQLVTPRLLLLDRASVEAFTPAPAGRPKEKQATKRRKAS